MIKIKLFKKMYLLFFFYVKNNFHLILISYIHEFKNIQLKPASYFHIYFLLISYSVCNILWETDWIIEVLIQFTQFVLLKRESFAHIISVRNKIWKYLVSAKLWKNLRNNALSYYVHIILWKEIIDRFSTFINLTNN